MPVLQNTLCWLYCTNQLQNMKKILIVSLLAASAIVCKAQQNKIGKSQVPEAVLKAYASQNSLGAKDTVWETEMTPIYKMRHQEDGRETVWEYNAKGNWLRTYTVIGLEEIPLLVANQLQTMYPSYSITQGLIELSSNGKLYAITMQRGQSVITEYFLMNGKLFR